MNILKYTTKYRMYICQLANEITCPHQFCLALSPIKVYLMGFALIAISTHALLIKELMVISEYNMHKCEFINLANYQIEVTRVL